MQRRHHLQGLLRAALCSLVLAGMPAWAGDAGTIYSELTFIDVRAGEAGALRAELVEVMQPLMQQRIDDGELFAWALYGAEYGAGAHDMVLVRQAIDFDALGPPRISEELWQQVHGRKNRERLLSAISQRYKVTERVVYALTQYHTNMEQRERPWLMLSYVRTRPGQAMAFRQQMDEAWRPVLAEWVANGPAAAFSLYEVAQPAAGGHWHDQVMVTQYPGFTPLKNTQGPFVEAFRSARPDADMAETLAAWALTAEVVATETWQLLELAARRPPEDS